MRYALLCYDCEAVVGALSKHEDEAMMTRLAAVNQKLAATGKLAATLRLMPTTAATTVRAGDEPLVLDGPFAETKEQLLGLWLLDCASLDEAIEAASLLSEAKGLGALEIRPVAWFDGGSAVP